MPIVPHELTQGAGVLICPHCAFVYRLDEGTITPITNDKLTTLPIYQLCAILTQQNMILNRQRRSFALN